MTESVKDIISKILITWKIPRVKSYEIAEDIYKAIISNKEVEDIKKAIDILI